LNDVGHEPLRREIESFIACRRRVEIAHHPVRSWWRWKLKMIWIGIIVAVVTYGLGLAFGALG